MEDQLNQNKTIYEVSAGEVFFKNFLAGFGRALGGVFIYLIFMLISVYSFLTFAYPQIKPFIADYQRAIQGLNSINQKGTTVPGTGQDTEQYKKMLQDLQISLPK
jgi:hypothetical protein